MSNVAPAAGDTTVADAEALGDAPPWKLTDDVEPHAINAMTSGANKVQRFMSTWHGQRLQSPLVTLA